MLVEFVSYKLTHELLVTPMAAQAVQTLDTINT